MESLDFTSGSNLNRQQHGIGEMRGQPGPVCSIEPVVRKIRSGDEALCGNRLYQGCRDQDQGGGQDPPRFVAVSPSLCTDWLSPNV